MNYLAIDTASTTLKILYAQDGEYRYFQSENFRATSEILFTEIDHLRQDAQFSDLDYLACVIGPGSFTGIRIGLSAIKGFAYVLGKPIVAVNTLQLLAYNNSGNCDTVIAVCDAGNNFRYVAVFDEKLRAIMQPKCLKTEELAGFISMVDEPCEIYCDEISKADLPRGIVPTSDDFKWALIKAAEKGEAMSYNDIEPLYIRKPQAELDLEKNDTKG